MANVLAWSLAILAVRAVPLRSFKVAALLLAGLFFYDVFFVFGTDIMVCCRRGVPSTPVEERAAL